MIVDYVLIKAAGLPSIVVQPNVFDTVVPRLLSAELDFFNSSKVIVTFSEPVALDSANFSINNGASVVAVSQGKDLNLVVLDVSGLTSGSAYTLTVNGVADLAGNLIVPSSQVVINTCLPLPHRQGTDPNALLVLEAEHASRNIPGDGTTWTFTTAVNGYSGSGAMQTLPNSGRNVNVDISASPRLDFRVMFHTEGTYYVSVRGHGDTVNDDSVNVGLDNALPSTSARIANFTLGGEFFWSSTQLGGARAQFQVASPGVHVITLWMREDGFIVDKLIITSNSSYAPTGLDAPESAVDQPPIQIAIARQGGHVALTWLPCAVLQSAASLTGPWTDVSDATSPYLVLPARTQSYFRLRQ